MSYFKKYKNFRMKPGYKHHPNYHTLPEDTFKGRTLRFRTDYKNFLKEFPQYRIVLSYLIDLIVEYGYPKNITAHLDRRCVWECLRHYTKRLDKERKFVGLNLVMSIAIQDNYDEMIKKGIAIDFTAPVDKSHDTGIRLVYEVINNERIILTNLNYHYYRNSAYSDNLV